MVSLNTRATGASSGAPSGAPGGRLLANGTVTLARGGDRVHVTGLDDVHYFYSAAASAALDAAPDGFRIALVHSPEIAGRAAAAGFALYVTGHTHGGQVCLPGGRPIATNLRRHRRFAPGPLRRRHLLGYTSPAARVPSPPPRSHPFGAPTMPTPSPALP